MKPNYLKTDKEKDAVARKFAQLHERPHTDDWTWYDCERNGTLPRLEEMNPNSEHVTHKGNWCIYNNKVFCQEGFCSNCEIFQQGERK